MTSREITVALWVVIAAGAVFLEVLSYASRRFIAPAGTVARLATRPVIGRIVVSLAWMWLGWHVFAR
ncbi:MAG: DUF6186 family protein [Acidimicrobiales bacterium]